MESKQQNRNKSKPEILPPPSHAWDATQRLWGMLDEMPGQKLELDLHNISNIYTTFIRRCYLSIQNHLLIKDSGEKEKKTYSKLLRNRPKDKTNEVLRHTDVCMYKSSQPKK